VVGGLLGTALVAPPGFATPAAPLPAKPPSKDALDKKISQASDQLDTVVEQYDATRVALAGTKKQIAQVDGELKPLLAAQGTARATVGVIAANVYQHSSPIATFGGLLISSSAPALVNQLGMIDHLAHQQNQQIAAYQSVSNALSSRKKQLTSLENKQKAQYAVLRARRSSILQQISDLRSMRLVAYGPTGAPPEPKIHYIPPLTPGAGGTAVNFAYHQLGKAYRFGAAGPSAFDCSGLTMMAWQKAGVSLPHSAAQQYRDTKRISRSDLHPGDLVFYYHPIHHVAIYVGDDKVIAAPTYGEPVKVSPVGLAPIAGYGRP